MRGRPRPWGTGTVYRDRSRWRARLPGKHGRKPLDGSFATRAEAEAALSAALELLAAAPLGAATLLSVGEDWLADGVRDVRASCLDRDRLRWSAYVETHEIAARPIVEIEEHDVSAWLAGLRGTKRPMLSAQTKQNALSLLRGAFEFARQRGGPLYGRPNPAAEVTLGKREREQKTERWSWLRAHEVATVRAADLPAKAHAIFVVAMFTGLRAGELWGLRWTDVDLARGVLSVGHSRGEATKGGRPREVPLLAPARAALQQWRVLYDAAGVRSYLGLVWPSPHGGHHDEGYDADWSSHAETMGVGHATFHDLRHTCASHLVMGTWSPSMIARPLRLEEVKTWLGHRNIATTERYAHLAPESIAGLVREPSKRRIAVKLLAASGPRTGPQNQAAPQNRTGDLRFTKPQRARQVVLGFPPAEGDAARVAARLRRAAERYGDAVVRADPHRDHRGAELLEVVAEVAAVLRRGVAADETG
jgi:integrase